MWRKYGLVSDNKLELYGAISRELSQQLDSDKEGVLPERKWLIADPDGSIKLDFLRQLAFDMIFRGIADSNQSIMKDLDRLIFSTDTLLKTARLFAKRIETLDGITLNPRHLTEDAKASALLRQIGADKYAFTHLTLQEYLAAVELAKSRDCERIFCRAYFNTTLVGMEVLPMTLGIIEAPEKLYQAINLLPESLSFTGMNLLARGLDYGAVISDKLLHELTDRLIGFLVWHDINVEKSEFLRSFTWLRKRPVYFERVVSLLKHENSEVQSRVAALLGVIGSELITSKLLDLLNNENSEVRGSVALALGNIGDNRAVFLLLRLLEEDPENSDKYTEALHKLGQLDDDQVSRCKANRLKKIIIKSDLCDEIKRLLTRDLSTHGLTDWLEKRIKDYCLDGLRRIDTQILKAAIILYRDKSNLNHNAISTIVNIARRNKNTELREQAEALLQEIGEKEIIQSLYNSSFTN